MTKKNFELIALIIRCTPHNKQTPLTYENLVSKFCDSLEHKYPKFDRIKFLKACGVEVEKNCIDCGNKIDNTKNCLSCNDIRCHTCCHNR